MITNPTNAYPDKGQFTISQITHELRNPLTLIYSTLQLIESKHPEVKSYSQWDGLFFDVEYMIDFLAKLSRYQHCGETELESVDLISLLKYVCISFAASVTDSAIEFTSSIDPELPIVTADHVHLREVLLNLLRNSVDAIDPMHTHKSEGKITLTATTDGRNIHIKISDTGCGMDSDQLSHAFDPFTTYKKDGTGIGLPIVRRILEAHHGSVELTSTEGVGTTASVTFPIEQD